MAVQLEMLLLLPLLLSEALLPVPVGFQINFSVSFLFVFGSFDTPCDGDELPAPWTLTGETEVPDSFPLGSVPYVVLLFASMMWRDGGTGAHTHPRTVRRVKRLLLANNNVPSFSQVSFLFNRARGHRRRVGVCAPFR